MVNLNQKVTKRECGECDVCCVVAEVNEGQFNKPACVACPYLNKTGTKRCGIFGKAQRPQICSDFKCGWLRGAGKNKDRPDKSNVMVSVNNFNGGRWIFVLDNKKDAHKTTGKSIIIEMINKFNLPAIVLDYDHLEKGKGDYVIITDNMKPRSSQILGDLIEDFDDMKIYKLIISTE